MTDPKERKAPKGKYRVLLYDSFDHEDAIILTTKFKQTAIDCAKSKSGQMLIAYVVDDKGKTVYKAGSY